MIACTITVNEGAIMRLLKPSSTKLRTMEIITVKRFWKKSWEWSIIAHYMKQFSSKLVILCSCCWIMELMLMQRQVWATPHYTLQHLTMISTVLNSLFSINVLISMPRIAAGRLHTKGQNLMGMKRLPNT